MLERTAYLAKSATPKNFLTTIKPIRSAIAKAQFNSSAISIVSWELVLTAVAFGIGYQSWWIGGFTFFFGIIALMTPFLNILFTLAMTVLWGIIGFKIGEIIDQSGSNYIICLVSSLSSLGIHLGAMQWVEDINSDH